MKIQIFILLGLVQLFNAIHNKHVIKIKGPVRRTCFELLHHGFKCVRRVFDDYYVVQKLTHNRIRRSVAKPGVNFDYIEKLKPLQRQKRTIISRGISTKRAAAEQAQWYIYDTHDLNMSMGIEDAWNKGYFGQHVTVTVVDDGLQRTHDGLKDNYCADASYDLNDDDGDPTPRYNLTFTMNKHGTRIAGVIAATQNHTNCGKGIAFKSKLGGIRLLDGMIDDELEAQGLIKRMNLAHIKSFAWGPFDDGTAWEKPGPLTQTAILKNIHEGRSGLGTILVWAVGNGGTNGDNCGPDGYSNSIESITVSSILSSGRIPAFVEYCSATMSATFSNGRSGTRPLITTDINDQCTDRLTATSASAAVASGIYALLLSARPDLNWRDVQHLTVRNSHLSELNVAKTTNAAGFTFNPYIGFGLMNANDMITMAAKWERVPQQQVCRLIFAATFNRSGLNVNTNTFSTSLESDSCIEDNPSTVIQLEHVQLEMTLQFTRRQFSKRGRLEINLTSPSGTKSTLLRTRGADENSQGFERWPFTTVHFWGERAYGDWTVNIRNHDLSIRPYQLQNMKLTLYGTKRTIREPNADEEDVKCNDIEVKHRGSCVLECPRGHISLQINSEWVCKLRT